MAVTVLLAWVATNGSSDFKQGLLEDRLKSILRALTRLVASYVRYHSRGIVTKYVSQPRKIIGQPPPPLSPTSIFVCIQHYRQGRATAKIAVLHGARSVKDLSQCINPSLEVSCLSELMVSLFSRN